MYVSAYLGIVVVVEVVVVEARVVVVEVEVVVVGARVVVVVVEVVVVEARVVVVEVALNNFLLNSSSASDNANSTAESILLCISSSDIAALLSPPAQAMNISKNVINPLRTNLCA